MRDDKIIEVIARALSKHEHPETDHDASWFRATTGPLDDPPAQPFWTFYSDAATAALSALRAAGLDVVPVEPSEAMLDAACHAPMPMVMLDSIKAQNCLRIRTHYAAMIAAAQESAE